MKWIDEPDEKDVSLVHHALMLEPLNPLPAACVEYWKRILSDGCACAAVSDWMSLSIDICDRQVDDDEAGYMHAMFCNGVKKSARGLGHYYVRGVAAAQRRSGDARRQRSAACQSAKGPDGRNYGVRMTACTR